MSDEARKAKATTVDAYGRGYSDGFAFEVAEERPFPYFRSDVFE